MERYADPKTPFFSIENSPDVQTILFAQNPGEPPTRVDLVFDHGALTSFKINGGETVSLKPEIAEIFQIAQKNRNSALAGLSQETFKEPLQRIADKVFEAGTQATEDPATPPKPKAPSDTNGRGWISIGAENAVKGIPQSYLYGKNATYFTVYRIASLAWTAVFIASNVFFFVMVANVGIPFDQVMKALPHILKSDGWILLGQRLTSSFFRWAIKITGEKYLQREEAETDKTKAIKRRLEYIKGLESNCTTALGQILRGIYRGTPFLRKSIMR